MLSGCVQSTTLFGPTITIAKSGSVYQGGLSYATNKLVANELGKHPTEFIEKIFSQRHNKNKTDYTINKKIDFRNIVTQVDEKSYEKDHTDFIKAVKKILK